MTQPPVLNTERLVLRPFRREDAEAVARLAGDRDVAFNALHIPHPMDVSIAEAWIESHEEAFQEGLAINFAIVLRDEAELVGAVGLLVRRDHRRAELGYWIGKPYWGRGYATEAARAVVDYAFRTLGLNRVQADHLARNPGSGRVLQKLGMRHEGTLREYAHHWGRFEDLELYALVREDYLRTVPDSDAEPGPADA